MHLPEDLVVEILSRVPAVSLARLRSTSKEWNALIKYGRLAKKHSAYAPRQSSLVIVLINFRVYLVSINLHGINNNKDVPSAKLTGQFSLKDPLSNNSSEEVGICSVFHCNGLLLCTTKANKLVVLNPCSGEKMWIQPRVITYKEYNHYALGYDNRSSCYKILSVDRSGYRFPFQTEYQVYDFTSKSWRVVGETGGLLIPRIQRLGISVKGNTYWLANNGQGRVILQCYDFSTERFQSLSLPKDAPRWYSDVALSVTREEQQLCMIAIRIPEVWIATKMESTGDISWSKFLTVSKFDLRHHLRFCLGMTFLVDQENKVVVSCSNSVFSNNIIQILGKDKYIHEDQHGAASPTPRLLTYVPGLVQIQQGI